MSVAPVNIHGTAIVIGTTGFLFIGPSGSGKSELAHACLSAAADRGLFARLIADDQIFLHEANGRMIGRRPNTIAGLVEIRGTGIARMASLPHAVLHVAVRPERRETMERLPPAGEFNDFGDGRVLPLLRLCRDAPDPLAILCRFVPILGLDPPFAEE